jgi:hypothetical protein
MVVVMSERSRRFREGPSGFQLRWNGSGWAWRIMKFLLLVVWLCSGLAIAMWLAGWIPFNFGPLILNTLFFTMMFILVASQRAK